MQLDYDYFVSKIHDYEYDYDYSIFLIDYNYVIIQSLAQI